MGDANVSRWKPTKFTTLSKYKQPLWLGNESAITNIRFQWMSKEEINILEEYSFYLRSRPRISTLPTYRENLHHHHNDYPFAAENIM